MEPIQSYVSDVLARSRLHAARKREQEAEAARLQAEALADAETYLTGMRLTGPDDAT